MPRGWTASIARLVKLKVNLAILVHCQDYWTTFLILI
jgi:hypothetical protein